MKAAIIDAAHQMRVAHWTKPKPGRNEVLVSVRAAGICAGDMYIHLGKNPYATYPQVCGHEVCGVVEEAGGDVVAIAPGDPVVVEPFLGCGRCYPCRIGKSNCCALLQIIGVQQPGGYAEYLRASARSIHPAPKGLSWVFASFAEPVAIAVQACRRGEVKAGEIVVILGCGSIGLALIEVAKARGAFPFATDISDTRLAFAEQMGATVLKADETLLANVLAQTNSEGAPVVIEATGSIRAMEQTVDLVAPGGRIVIVGLVKKGLEVRFPGLDFTRKEMTIVGSRASVNCFPEALELLASGKIYYPRVASEFSLWDAPEVFAKLAADPSAVHKGVLVT
ncbi:MAG: zinc-binding alcohol dehydrogenase family protein [Verrucomicrobia bacterium]|nr:zinc-binding alcohol dehydrogenase family protein [Verrucomicrobiota bacterium]